MKKSMLIILALFLLAALGCAKRENEVIRIGGIGFTLEEFMTAFKSSPSASAGEAGRREFLDSFITRKLMLKEAEQMGLNEDPKFLQGVQLFWEQSLLKLVLTKKSYDLSKVIKVEDKEIQDFYNNLKEQNIVDKDISKMYDQIKLILLKEKQREAIQDWIDSLKRETKIIIDYESIGLEKDN